MKYVVDTTNPNDSSEPTGRRENDSGSEEDCPKTLHLSEREDRLIRALKQTILNLQSLIEETERALRLAQSQLVAIEEEIDIDES